MLVGVGVGVGDEDVEAGDVVSPSEIDDDNETSAGDFPRYTVAPSGPTAVTVSRAGFSSRTPGGAVAGSHTKVTRVLPFAPRVVPSHVRTRSGCVRDRWPIV